MEGIFTVLLLQLVLIALNAIFASAEIAVLSINEAKLEKMSEDGNKRAKRLFKLTREPAKFLATIQVAITLSGFLGSAFAADSFSEPLVAWVKSLGVNLPDATLDAIAVVVITLILSYFTLVFGELVPKRLAMKKSESVAMGISGLVRFISVAFKPIVWFLSASTNVVLRLLGIDPNAVEDEVSEEEILMMVDAGSEKGAIEHEEKQLIENVFEFNDITAADIAVHRTEVTVLMTDDDDAGWEETIRNSRHTMYPVCGESFDDIVGILSEKDYFRLDDKTRENVLKNAVHPAYLVPETIKADALFRNMKSTKNTIAVVIDEYGGMEGIITLYDLLEALVGDLNTKTEDKEKEETKIEKAGGVFYIYGNVLLEELTEATGKEITSEDYDTLGGLVFDALGYIPDEGECNIDVELASIKITVSSVKAHQLERAVVSVIESTEEN